MIFNGIGGKRADGLPDADRSAPTLDTRITREITGTHVAGQ